MRSRGAEELSRIESCADYQACGLTALFPALETLYLNDNPRIVSLAGEGKSMGQITTLSVEGSGVTRWEDITCGLSSLARWVRLRRAVDKSRLDALSKPDRRQTRHAQSLTNTYHHHPSSRELYRVRVQFRRQFPFSVSVPVADFPNILTPLARLASVRLDLDRLARKVVPKSHFSPIPLLSRSTFATSRGRGRPRRWPCRRRRPRPRRCRSTQDPFRPGKGQTIPHRQTARAVAAQLDAGELK